MTEATGWTDAELARLRLEGLDHLAHLLSGTATERDAAEFVAWRMRSRAHEEAFRSAVRLGRLARSAAGLENTDGTLGVGAPPALPIASNDARGDEDGPDGTVVTLDGLARRRVSRRALIGGGLAASVAGGMLLLGRSMDLVPSIAELRAGYRTGTGERRVVQLAGGASVELNTRTSIGLRIDIAIPAVELIRGEALMTNGRSGRAALLAGQGMSIGSNGRFNVRRDGDDVCVTCLAGQVDVNWAGQKRLLGERRQVRYNDNGIGAVLDNIDTVAITAWKAGTLIFHNMPMRAVIEEINRYRPGKVILLNEKLASLPLSGTYYVNRLDEFFSQTELAFGAKVIKLPGDLIIVR